MSNRWAHNIICLAIIPMPRPRESPAQSSDYKIWCGLKKRKMHLNHPKCTSSAPQSKFRFTSVNNNNWRTDKWTRATHNLINTAAAPPPLPPPRSFRRLVFGSIYTSREEVCTHGRTPSFNFAPQPPPQRNAWSRDDAGCRNLFRLNGAHWEWAHRGWVWIRLVCATTVRSF